MMNSPNILKKKVDRPGKVTQHKKIKNGVECHCEGGVKLRVTVITPDIVRFRYALDGPYPADFSYALDPNYIPRAGKYTLTSTRDELRIQTERVAVNINTSDLKVTISDLGGNTICEDKKGYTYVRDYHGCAAVSMSKKIQAREAYYGLGDKPTELNLRGKHLMNWGTDAYDYQKNTDPLYKNIPFYYGLHKGIGYGIFFDNTFRSRFDFGSKTKNELTFAAEGGEMNYYYIAGPQLMDVCERYTMLTGTPDMPPMWALGFQQCRWSYYPEKRVKAIATKMRKLKIPCDAIYLDIDYMDGYRCFTWDQKKFPNPKRMVKDLKKQGFKTVVMIDPGIKIDEDYFVYKEAIENNYFCRRPDGPIAKGIVWPGYCHFPDYTHPEVREWWGTLYKDLITKMGVDGVWNDMNEPALFQVETKTLPEDVMHHYDGHMGSHAKTHNVYGMQMARATFDGIKKLMRGNRTLVITRSGYAGFQRFSSAWTGDNTASWEHIWVADVQCQRLSISGVSFCGSDIGGFIGNPTGEMMVRWIQLGIFHPFCRIHSQGEDADQEPWSYGTKYTKIIRRYLELRYELLPYMYTAFYHYHKLGTPMLIPLVFAAQEDTKTKDRDHEFLCGPDLLTLPITEANQKTTKVYLPDGIWYHYMTHKAYKGGKEYKLHFELDEIPLFAKAGAIIPHYPSQEYVDQNVIHNIKLHVYYTDGKVQSTFYEDNHTNYDYEDNAFRLSTFTNSGSSRQISISQKVEGKYIPIWTTFTLRLIGLPFDKYDTWADGVLVDSKEMKVPANFKKIVIKAKK